MDPSSDVTARVAELVVRPAQLADVDGIVQVHVESAEDSYAPLAQSWPAVDVQQRRVHWAGLLSEGLQGAARRVDVVAERAGNIIGFCSGGPARDRTHCAELELYVIHVLPRERARGVGALLWREACQRLRGAASSSMYVSTLAELRCCSFYRRHGGAEVSRRMRQFYGAERTEVIYLWAAGCPNQP